MNYKMRLIHRYLGFFLAGIMAVYAISGIALVFRNTDVLKKEELVTKELDKNLKSDQLSKQIKIKGFKVTEEKEGVLYFKEGAYDPKTGLAVYTKKSLPYFLDKMVKMHKATTNSPLFYLNIFFGLSLLFFVISSFWMFMPKTEPFKKGLYFSLGGIVLTLIMIFI